MPQENHKVVCWQPVITDHMSYTLQALSDVSGCQLIPVVLKDISKDRARQGWKRLHSEFPSPKVLHKVSWFAQSIRLLCNYRDEVQIFGSPFESTKLIVVLILASMFCKRVYLVSEPFSPGPEGYQDCGNSLTNKIKSRLRPFIYQLYGLILRKKISGVFAISSLAVTQYRRMGFSPASVFPFGYFVPTHQQAPSERGDCIDRGLRLIFVGNMIPRKGLDILIRAMASLASDKAKVSLDVYGPGDQAFLMGAPGNVNYCGLIPFGEAQKVISKYDALVLPSRYDGWGVVVNEAVLAGVPVFCSDSTGAAGMISKWNCGLTFRSGDVVAIIELIHMVAKSPGQLDLMRKNTRDLALRIQPDAAARFMNLVIFGSAMGASPDEMTMPGWYD